MNAEDAISIEEITPPEIVEFVQERLREFNDKIAGPDRHRSLNVILRDSKKEIVGGLLGGTYWGWMHVEILWIREDFRRKGYGRALLATAEQEARRRDCAHVHLETMSWQAVAFYAKQGYRVFGQLEDLPMGHSKYFLTKALV